MAREAKTEESTVEKTTEKATGGTTGLKFELAKLQEHCGELFGVSTSTFVGATHGLNGLYSISEVKEAINKWSKQEVK